MTHKYYTIEWFGEDGIRRYFAGMRNGYPMFRWNLVSLPNGEYTRFYKTRGMAETTLRKIKMRERFKTAIIIEYEIR